MTLKKANKLSSTQLQLTKKVKENNNKRKMKREENKKRALKSYK